MQLLVLAAGYATRLYPLTLDCPKHLLEVAGRPVLERVLEKLAPIRDLEAVYVLTNAKFAGRFQEWAAGYRPPRRGLEPIVVDDGTTDDASKLGAIGDLAFVIETQGIEDDLIVAAGDQLFTEELGGFGNFCREQAAPVLAVYDVGSLEDIKRYSAISVDGDGRITSFVEKPERPSTTLAGIALYFYPRATFPLIRRYLDEGNDPDQPGRLVEWLYPRVTVYAWPVPGRWLDIGSQEALRDAERMFAQS